MIRASPSQMHSNCLTLGKTTLIFELLQQFFEWTTKAYDYYDNVSNWYICNLIKCLSFTLAIKINIMILKTVHNLWKLEFFKPLRFHWPLFEVQSTVWLKYYFQACFTMLNKNYKTPHFTSDDNIEQTNKPDNIIINHRIGHFSQLRESVFQQYNIILRFSANT